MALDSKVRVGDRVRVTYEGEVTEANDYLFVLDGAREFSLITHSLASTLTVLERAKPEVGDTLETVGEVFDLPAWSVVLNRFGSPLVLNEHDEIVSRLGQMWTRASARGRNAPYRIAHLRE